ncbi:hypothetical protein MMPV_001071 [Pyropia vietnamensis]
MAELIRIKVTVAGTLRRLSVPAAPPPTFGTLLAAAAAPHGLAPADVAAATYTDADGDEVTLSSDAELAEALREGGVLRLQLTVLPPPVPSAPPSPLSTDGEGEESQELGGTLAAGEAFVKGVPPVPLYPSVDRPTAVGGGGSGKDAPASVNQSWGMDGSAAAAAVVRDHHPVTPLSPLHPDADPPDSLDGEVAESAALVVARPGAAAISVRTGSFPEWTPPPPPPVEVARAPAETDAVVVAGAPGGDAGAPSRLSDVLGEGLKAVIDVGVEPIVKAAKLAWGDGEGLRLLSAPDDVDEGEPSDDHANICHAKSGHDVCVHDRDSGIVGQRRPPLPPAGVAALATSLHGALTDDGVAWAPATAIAAALHALLSATWVGRAVAWVHAKHTEKERKAAQRRQLRRQGAWWLGPPPVKAAPSLAGWGCSPLEAGGGCGHGRRGGKSAKGRCGTC